MNYRRLLTYAKSNRRRYVQDLVEFVRIPSVSAQPEHVGNVRRCGEWLADHLKRVGLEHVHLTPTARHPIVCAAWRRAPGRPTVLIYGHYDVQPVDPIGEWRTPPFDPRVQNGNLYGRGASDDKGQLFCLVKALEAYLRTTGQLPVNVICLFEGEEEIGSPSLRPWLLRNKEQFRADVAVISDTRFLAPGRPAITYALRGALGAELTIRSLPRDVHSGSFGGTVHNPIQILCAILTQLHDAEGRIMIPGFYERVRQWSPAEREHMRRTGPSDEQILRDAGAQRGWGEPGFSAYERVTIRPALTINGITGGYQGSGGKGIVPAQASAKLSFRLVPDQDPRHVEQLLRRHLARLTPSTAQAALEIGQRTQPALIDRSHPAMQAAALAYRRGFGAAPVFLRSGGSIPVVNMLQEVLGIPTVLMGFALPDDRSHAPNEKFALSQFFNGINTCIHFLQAVGDLPASPSRVTCTERRQWRAPSPAGAVE